MMEILVFGANILGEGQRLNGWWHFERMDIRRDVAGAQLKWGVWRRYRLHEDSGRVYKFAGLSRKFEPNRTGVSLPSCKNTFTHICAYTQMVCNTSSTSTSVHLKHLKNSLRSKNAQADIHQPSRTDSTDNRALAAFRYPWSSRFRLKLTLSACFLSPFISTAPLDHQSPSPQHNTAQHIPTIISAITASHP